MRLGKQFKFVPEYDLPHLESKRIAKVCDDLVAGQQCYQGLLYLGRACVHDIEAVFEASQDKQTKVRWQRLWVLSPVLSRLARSSEGAAQIRLCLLDDFPALHLMSKFDQTANTASGRFFKRMGSFFLPDVIDMLIKHYQSPKRASLLANIVACFEPTMAAVQRALKQAPPDVREEVLALLPEEIHNNTPHRLDTQSLRKKLTALKQTTE